MKTWTHNVDNAASKKYWFIMLHAAVMKEIGNMAKIGTTFFFCTNGSFLLRWPNFTHYRPSTYQWLTFFKEFRYSYKWKSAYPAVDISPTYSRVHKSSDSFFLKILEKPSIVQKKIIPHMKGLRFSVKWSKKKFKMADSKNSKWPSQKNLILPNGQFSIFFCEIKRDGSLG